MCLLPTSLLQMYYSYTLQSFFVCSLYYSFVGYVCYKFLFPGCGLSFHSVVSCDEYILNSNIVKFINLCLYNVHVS